MFARCEVHINAPVCAFAHSCPDGSGYDAHMLFAMFKRIAGVCQKHADDDGNGGGGGAAGCVKWVSGDV